MLSKGTKVRVHKSVYTKQRNKLQPFELHENDWYGENLTNIETSGYTKPRDLRRVTHDKPIEGIVVGWSTRISGKYLPGSNWGSPGGLYDTTHHTVIMVQPTNTSRWIKDPLACLEEDLEVLDGH